MPQIVEMTLSFYATGTIRVFEKRLSDAGFRQIRLLK